MGGQHCLFEDLKLVRSILRMTLEYSEHDLYNETLSWRFGGILRFGSIQRLSEQMPAQVQTQWNIKVKWLVAIATSLTRLALYITRTVVAR